MMVLVNALGCTDATACNYDASATCDDGSCFMLMVVQILQHVIMIAISYL